MASTIWVNLLISKPSSRLMERRKNHDHWHLHVQYLFNSKTYADIKSVIHFTYYYVLSVYDKTVPPLGTYRKNIYMIVKVLEGDITMFFF